MFQGLLNLFQFAKLIKLFYNLYFMINIITHKS